MFEATDTAWAPWYVVNSDDKKRARLNIITHLLEQDPVQEGAAREGEAAQAAEAPRLPRAGVSVQLRQGAFLIRRRKAPIWSIPAWYSVAALLAALFLPRFESSLGPNFDSGVDPAALLAMFSSIGSGMIALTGIVFSLTFVMVQFSATAYSPRLVLWIARDPLLWHSVGIFSATFLYAIAAIAWVRARRQGAERRSSAAWLVIGLLLASVGMFIALIEKISLLQIHRMLAFTARPRAPRDRGDVSAARHAAARRPSRTPTSFR